MKRFNHTKKKGIIQKNQDFKIIFYQMPQIMKQGEGSCRLYPNLPSRMTLASSVLHLLNPLRFFYKTRGFYFFLLSSFHFL
jgi:hypothetical protein